ncbi:MAG: OmpH family outer membrane protein [Balneolales bacterium]
MIRPRSRYFFPAFFLILGLSMTVQAQNQKFGYIDSDYILSHIPEYEGIEQRLEGLVQTWEEELDEMQEDIDALKQQYEAREILYTEDVRSQKEEEIRQKVREREQLIDTRFGPDGEYFSQQQELLEPLQQRILEATTNIADREGFDFIFDRSGDYMFMYARQSWDLSDDILLEMGIQVEEIQ